MKLKATFPLMISAVLGLSSMAWMGNAAAQESHMHTGHGGTASASAELTDGEIRKIDKAAGALTVKHGPIKRFDMPGMTMVLHVSDSSRIDQLQVGDKVRFRVEKEGEKFLAMEIEPIRR
ncbi:copper-binding protein [Burkholderia anthina]|uniref:copper-binding protein n=1 Tax=Burkholderia anthina TaxID=179879 RepID=UPI00272D5A20